MVQAVTYSGGQGSVQSHWMWDVSWTKRKWNTDFCVYLGFPLLVIFHRYPMLIHSSITDGTANDVDK